MVIAFLVAYAHATNKAGSAAMKRPFGDHRVEYMPIDPGSELTWWLARSRTRSSPFGSPPLAQTIQKAEVRSMTFDLATFLEEAGVRLLQLFLQQNLGCSVLWSFVEGRRSLLIPST